jgi:hypothetical protein
MTAYGRPGVGQNRALRPAWHPGNGGLRACTRGRARRVHARACEAGGGAGA